MKSGNVYIFPFFGGSEAPVFYPGSDKTAERAFSASRLDPPIPGKPRLGLLVGQNHLTGCQNIQRQLDQRAPLEGLLKAFFRSFLEEGQPACPVL